MQKGTKMNKKILEDAIKTYGDTQLIIAIEEMAELQKEIVKHLRGHGDVTHIAEETADVLIMLEQIKIRFGIDKAVDEWIKFKVDRLKGMVSTD